MRRSMIVGVLVVLAVVGPRCLAQAPTAPTAPAPAATGPGGATGSTGSTGAGTPAAQTREARWREDLAYLAAELPKRHKNAFFKCGKEDFLAAAAKLNEEIPALTDTQIVVGMMKLVAMLGDAHTTISPAAMQPPARYFPLSLYWFKDGIYIVGARESQKDLIGNKLVRFGETPAEEACTRVGSAFAFENDATFRNLSLRYLVTGEIAAACGLIPSAEQASIVVSDAEGRERTVELTPMVQGERMVLNETDNAKLPVWRQKRATANWYEYSPGSKELFFYYGRCADEEKQKVIPLVNEMLEFIDANPVDRVIVDLRTNGGGNSALLYGFIQGLKSRPAFNQPGRVIVLIGRFTFSSAQLNAWNLKNAVGAVLIGEPTGQKPNAYGEVKKLQLPNSKLVVNYSTKFFRTEEGDRPSMEPDIRVDLSSAEFFANKDPVLDAARAYTPVPR